jgi:tetratricopeptide (TPR) repeat protein
MNFLNGLFRWLAILLGIALTVLAAYVIWRLIKAHWAPIIFFAFLIEGILYAVLAVGFWAGARSSDGQEFLLSLYQEITLKALTPLERLQQGAERLLFLLELLTGSWFYPAAIRRTWLKLSRRPLQVFDSPIQSGVRLSLEGVAAADAPTGLVLVLVAYGIAYVAPAEMHWTRAFLMLMGVNTMLRLVRYVVGSTPLPNQLRRSTLRPYLAFVIVAVTDLLSLTLVLNGILHWKGGEIASLPAIWDVLRRLCFAEALGLVKDVLNGREPPLTDVLLTGVGLLYSGTLLKTLRNFKKFRRKDADYAHLASLYCLIGHYTDALKALEKINAPSSEARLLRVAAYIGLSRLEKAWEECERVLRSETDSVDPARIFYTLANLSAMIPLKPEAYVEILKRAIKDGSDLAAYHALSIFVPILRVKPEALRPLFNDTAMAKRFPLSYGLLLFLAKEQAEVVRSWLDQVEPLDVAEKIVYRQLVLRTRLATMELRAKEYFDEWSSQNFDEISHWISNPLPEGFDAVERSLVFGPILVVEIFAVRLDSQYEHRWHSVLEQLREGIEANQFWGKRRSFLQHVEGVVRRRIAAS